MIKQYRYFCAMRKFGITTSLIIIAAVVLLAIDCVYMVRLYDSIGESINRDIRAALAELDVDELWYRSTHQDEYEHRDLFAGSHGTVEGTLDNDHNFVVRRINEKGDTVVTTKWAIDKAYSYTNQMIGEMSVQMHFRIDPYLPIRLEPLDSLFRLRLAGRGITPDFIAVELHSGADSVIIENAKLKGTKDKFNAYELKFNSFTGEKYVAYISPLTKMVLERMWGGIAFTTALILLFVYAFLYMWRFIRRLRSIEELKDSFVNSMTHELKTPIAVAFSAADSLQRYYDQSTPEHNKEYIGIIQKELAKHSVMVENILSMSLERRKSMPIEHVSVGVLPLVTEICGNHKIKADKTAEFDIDISETLSVETDPMHFGNIINNLVENAMKYSGESVKISIAADEKQLSVSDNGIGIPAKYLPHIFDRFFRVPLGRNLYEVPGYGIGLFYVKEMCCRLGWSIAVDSTPGQGTTFTIRFAKDEE